MNDSIEILLDLIRNDKYSEAINHILKRRPLPVKILSLLFRLSDRYKEELNLINLALKQSPNNYIQERKKWHDTPIFERLVPRPPLQVQHDQSQTPPKEFLESTIYVVAGDSGYFELIVENLESLKATNTYKKLPIGIIDGGFTDKQKHILRSKFNAEIAPVQSNIKLHSSCPNQYAIVPEKVFLPHYFPGYEYYLFVDADSWIQDERALHKLADHCLKQKIGCSGLSKGTWGKCNLNQEKIKHWDKKDIILNSLGCSTGFFCVHKSIFPEWIKFFKENTTRSNGYHFSDHGEELSLTYIFNKVGGKEILDYPDGFAWMHEGLPVIKEDTPHILRAPGSLEIIGLPHLVGMKKEQRFIQTIKVKNPLQESEIQKHLTSTKAILKGKKVYQDTVAFRYRTWPWKDKPELKKQLMEEIKNV